MNISSSDVDFKTKNFKKKINLSGVGLHSGKNVNIRLVPQGPNTGIFLKELI